jgi:hypothetical protein
MAWCVEQEHVLDREYSSVGSPCTAPASEAGEAFLLRDAIMAIIWPTGARS